VASPVPLDVILRFLGWGAVLEVVRVDTLGRLDVPEAVCFGVVCSAHSRDDSTATLTPSG
jgi:hypothetical protein